MNLNCINTFSSRQFRKLGIYIGTHTNNFMIIPIFVSLILANGLQKWQENNNLKYLLGPDNTRHIKEEETIAKLFPMNLSSNANMEKMNREPCIAVALITAKDNGSIFRENIFHEILLLDKIIQNISVKHIKILKYKDLCAKNKNKCFENSILSTKNKIEMMTKGNYSIKYPLSRKGNQDFHLNSLFLGGVEVDEEDNVKVAKAMKLYYYLNDDSVIQKNIAEQWQSSFLNILASVNFQHIIVEKYTSITMEQELTKVVHKVTARMPIAIILISIFSILTCLYNNWNESKPWIGPAALISGGMALASSFGLIMYFNIPFIAATGSIPFLILGIGMDDAFVFLASWRRTDPKMSVSERLGEVYSESAISVTITSVTNYIAFISGLFAPYRMIRYFCLYASTAVVFCYIYQLTFIGACLACFGYLEKQNRHSLLFIRLEKFNNKGNLTWFYRNFCSSQSWKSKVCTKYSIQTIWMKLGNILSLWPIKILVLFTLIGHMAVGFWGITQTDLVGDTSQSSATDSYFLKYYDKNYKYFSHYKNRLQFVIDQELNYADTEIQKQIENLLKEMDEKGLIADSLTESWLRFYLEFLNDERVLSIRKAYNISDSLDFILLLRKVFLRHPDAQRFVNDITFNSNYTAIIGSRFFCQTNITKDEENDIINLQNMRMITDKAPFIVFPYAYFSFWADDVDLHIKFVIQILSSIAVIITVICFIFMPDIINTFSVIFSVISAEVCALGYMALWKVELAPVSIIVLVMCAGFSVDYSAHLSYAYKESKSKDPNQRLRDSINAVGLAIFQGSITTIISIVPLAYPLAYIFLALFKVIFLVVSFSAINALIFLPVLLTTLNQIKQNICGETEKIHINNNKSRQTDGNINLGYSL